MDRTLQQELADYAEQAHPGLIEDSSFFAFYVTILGWSRTNPRPYVRACRHYVLLRLFQDVVANRVPGAFAECGCYAGLSTVELCLTYRQTHQDWQGEGFHVFDSFAGLSQPTEHDQTGDDSLMTAGAFAASVEHVSGVLSALELQEVTLHPGWIPERFHDVEDLRFAFVHLDVDLYEPTRDALEFFYPRLSEGGMILTDDYGYADCPGAKQAFDDYAAIHGLTLQTTRTGQAYLKETTDAWRSTN